MKVLVTGCAGFIGYHVSMRLLREGFDVIGVDNKNNYYDVSLKERRLSKLNENKDFKFYHLDITSADVKQLIIDHKIDVVVNMAGQAGVRFSKENPDAFYSSNLYGFYNVLESCRLGNVKHLVYASSSSVYGNCKSPKFNETLDVTNPVSFYAATKVSNEVMAKSYKNMFALRTTGLRFFTVYGPYGRPDMAIFDFTRKIIEGQPITLFNNGKNKRDFTYIDDIVNGVVAIVKSENSSDVYNIGNNTPVETNVLVKTLENILGLEAKIENIGPVVGDVFYTRADTSLLQNDFGIVPKVTLDEGLRSFIKWYNEDYGVKAC